MNVAKIVIATALVLSFCVGTGCSDESLHNPAVTEIDVETPELPSEEVDNVDDEELTISWKVLLHTENPPSELVMERLSEIVGAKLETEWYYNSEKDEFVNEALASRRLGDVMYIPQFANNSFIVDVVKDKLFWDVEPYLEDFENLSKISQGRLESSKLEGTLYGVPHERPYARYGLLIRKDWLDNLGLEPPQTFDDVMALARAFTEEDPDGNGIDDTVGLVERSESFNLSFRVIAGYFGAPNFFEIDNGKTRSVFEHEGFFNAATKMRELYASGYLNRDWFSLDKDSWREMVAGGEGGMAFLTMSDTRFFNNVAIELGYPEPGPGWVLVNDITVDRVPRRSISDTENGVAGFFAIPTDIPKERMLKVLGFLDRLYGEEAFVLMSYGIEGLHFELTPEGRYKTLDEEKYTNEVLPLSLSRPTDLLFHRFPSDNEFDRMAFDLFHSNEPFAVLNPCQSLNSETFKSDWSRISDIMQMAYANYVMGGIELDEFKAERDRWLEEGGREIMEEYDEQLTIDN
ncbi:MAG: extracellular solute-binding protein [Oscillospiraceae bacterium]|nr:extracellular solute-binding protein [Oscillospiraceae bacterium]